MPRHYSGTCLHCHKEFTGATSRMFCCGDCYHAYRHQRTVRTCQQCGKTFYKKSQGHHGDPVYCSEKCMADAKKNQIEVKCLYCGKLFARKASQVLRHRAKYCSRKCANVGREDSVTIACLGCGKEFTVHRNRESTAFFCSRRCKVHYRGETTPERQIKQALDLLGIPYIQEHHVHPYTIDFFLVQYGIALEADGVYWHHKAHDKKRDIFLAGKNIPTVRITDMELRKTDAITLITNRLPRTKEFNQLSQLVFDFG